MTAAPKKHDVPALAALALAALGGVVSLGAVAHQQRAGTLFAPAVPPTWWAVGLQLAGVAVAAAITANPRLPRAPAVAALAFASYPLSNRAQDAILGGTPSTATTAAGVGFIMAAIGDYLAIMALGTKKQRDGGVGFVLTWRWFLALLSTLLAGGGLLIAMGASTAMAVRNKTVTFLLWVSLFGFVSLWLGGRGGERGGKWRRKKKKKLRNSPFTLPPPASFLPSLSLPPPSFSNPKNANLDFEQMTGHTPPGLRRRVLLRRPAALEVGRRPPQRARRDRPHGGLDRLDAAQRAAPLPQRRGGSAEGRVLVRCRRKHVRDGDPGVEGGVRLRDRRRR
jgi:hypothetical protein